MKSENIIRRSLKKKISIKRNGFTLIELLAVIIILGVLMIIAIPSVTEYIQYSRKNAYIGTAKNHIAGASTRVNSGEFEMYDTSATYYLPASCIPLEKGGDSPFGELEEAYVVVTYSGRGYDYYWTSRDETNMGILLANEKLLNVELVKPEITSIDTEIGVGDRQKILIINNCNSNDLTEKAATSTIVEGGLLQEGNEISKRLYNLIATENLEDGKKVLDTAASTFVSSSTGIDFDAAPSNTNGKGIYIRSGTENNQYPIYYYRGEVTNNNVVFGGFCWKIVRTTETGGIKLIYNGIPTGGKCNNTGVNSQIGTSAFNENYDYNAYVGYMYGTPNSSSYKEEHLSTKMSKSSTIKTVIDVWYDKNMTSYTSYLEDAIWCNDRSFGTVAWDNGNGTGTEVTVYGAQTRDYSETATGPSLECVNQNDRFTVNENMTGRLAGNGALIYPVGLLTADEVTFAGQGWNSYASNNYLHTGSFWWTMTPYRYANNHSYMFRVNSATYSGNVEDAFGIRPVVSLKNGTLVSVDGDGSSDNPFIVQ